LWNPNDTSVGYYVLLNALPPMTPHRVVSSTPLLLSYRTTVRQNLTKQRKAQRINKEKKDASITVKLTGRI
jgi:hypothetical protein